MCGIGRIRLKQFAICFSILYGYTARPKALLPFIQFFLARIRMAREVSSH